MRWRGWKRYMFLLSIVCGAIYCIETRYGFFRLRDIEMIPKNIIPDELIWQALPKGSQVFWPSLLFNGRDFGRGIMDYYPVSMRLKLIGWGRFKAVVAPLEIFTAVSWNSRMWWLSADGRIWLAALPAMTRIRGVTYPEKPMLSWDSRMPLPMDAGHSGDIYPSSLPLVKIKKWYDTIDKIGWKKDIYCLTAKKTGGRYVVQILLGSEGRITGEILVKEDVSNWLPLAAALKDRNIYPNASGTSPAGLLVDAATFTGSVFSVSRRSDAGAR